MKNKQVSSPVVDFGKNIRRWVVFSGDRRPGLFHIAEKNYPLELRVGEEFRKVVG